MGPCPRCMRENEKLKQIRFFFHIQSGEIMTFPESDQEIIKYLLHDLSEYELSVMEQRAPNDSAFFELVASVEDELIMQYVRDDMGQSLKQRFEKAYLDFR